MSLLPGLLKSERIYDETNNKTYGVCVASAVTSSEDVWLGISFSAKTKVLEKRRIKIAKIVMIFVLFFNIKIPP